MVPQIIYYFSQLTSAMAFCLLFLLALSELFVLTLSNIKIVHKSLERQEARGNVTTNIFWTIEDHIVTNKRIASTIKIQNIYNISSLFYINTK